MKKAKDDVTPLIDMRLDRITDRVIDFMDKTPVESWEKEQWNFYKTLWEEQKTRRKEETTLSHKSMEDLKQMISGAH